MTRYSDLSKAAGFALLLAFPSSAFFQEHTGLLGLMVYVAGVVAITWGLAARQPKLRPFLDRHHRLLSAMALAGLVGGFAVLNPIEDGRGPGKSSDRDEGLEMAVGRLLEGENPYYPQNSTAGPLSVLPGAILLAAPFVVLGSVGMQNVFWLAILLVALGWHFRSRGGAFALWLLPLAISPAVQYEFVSGGDLIANGIYIAVFLLLAARAWSLEFRADTGTSRAASSRSTGNPPLAIPLTWAIASSVLLGMGLASRANFILLLPLLGAYLWRSAGPKHALAACSVSLLAFTAITLPFYLADPSAFTPLMSRNKLLLAAHAPAWADQVILLATGLTVTTFSLFMILSTRRCDLDRLFKTSTLVTLTPMLLAVIGSSLLAGRPDFGFMHDRFGVMYLFTAILGYGATLTRPAMQSDAPGSA